MADKKGRVQAVIQKNLSEIIIYELKTNVTKFVSINAVRMTSDYSYCKVYVSDINPEKTDEVVSYLNNNAKKIRTMLSKKLSIYKTPELSFLADKSFEEESEMKGIIEMAINKKPVTLKDVFGDDEKNEKKEKKNMKKPTNKKTATKKETAVKSTAKKTTTKTTTKKTEAKASTKTVAKKTATIKKTTATKTAAK